MIPNHESDEIDLKDLFYNVLKFKKAILVTTIIGALIGCITYGISFYLHSRTELYSIESSIAVNAQYESGKYTSSNGANPNYTDIQLAENLVDSVIYVCTSDTVLEKASEELRLIGVEPKDIRDKIMVEQYLDTMIIRINLIWYNKEEGVLILNAITEVVPEVLIDVLKVGNVSIVNEPKASPFFDIPIKPTHIIYITFVFFGIAVGIAALKTLLNPTVTNLANISSTLGIEPYGYIPKDEEYKNSKAMFINPNYMLPLIINEAYSALAYTFQYYAGDQEHPIISITSTTAQEGKTSIVGNLGMQMARQHKKVLLFDLDLRRPTLSNFFQEKADYSKSLNAILRKHSNAKDCVVHINEYLDILPTILEENPLFFSPMISRIIHELAQDYDLVLVDTSPVGLVSDTLFIKKIADIVFYVIRYDYASISIIKKSIEKLTMADIKVGGCVINQVAQGALEIKSLRTYYEKEYGKSKTTTLTSDQ